MIDMPVYQNVTIMKPLIEALEANCDEGEKVIWRDAFRWKDSNGVLSNAYEMFGVEQVAQDRNWEIVANFCHAAIVRPV